MHEVRQTIHRNIPGTIGIFFGRFPPLRRLFFVRPLIVTQGFRTSYLDEPVKLSELRAKTDEQLQGLVNSKLELGLNFVVLGEVEGLPVTGRKLNGRSNGPLKLCPKLNDCSRP